MGKRAEKLYAEMGRTKAGWKASDYRRLFEGFGFSVSERGRDTQYYHPDHPDIVCYVTRSSGDLATGYASTAVKVIAELQRRLKDADENESGNQSDGENMETDDQA